MNNKFFGVFGFTSVLLATSLVGFDARVAMACSGASSSGSGLSHGSSLGTGSVTVCVGAGSSSPASSSTQTITKTVTVKVPAKAAATPKKTAKPAPKPAPVAAKPAPKPIAKVTSCPSASQLDAMPRSADAAERWIQTICQPAQPKATTSNPVAKPAPKPAPKQTPKPSTKTKTITETITIEIPGSSSSSADAATLYPNQLIASVFPGKVLSIGQRAVFSSNPSAHYGVATVLGRQAQVHFVPQQSGWELSDGTSSDGADMTYYFESAGKYQVVAFVSYLVSYRLLGESNWIPVAGSLLVESNTLEIVVGGLSQSREDATGGALLVGQPCLPGSTAFGC